MGGAMAEALARHGHHALVEAHERAADNHRRLSQAGAGDVDEHQRLEQWHRWCAVVEDQLAAEADVNLPRPPGPS
ncbi:hypothetical protein [Planobispora takensis]|uniref:Uncharacterized protein n=1 Tax=Planobispora takensis TaxID=1367882 RepID=A0A8J3T338_9ACTN|nr:hypothetical protein [Planobispora takensis]GII05192.1 hypothetical protein Pta02_72000 [Planobispora takensis]